MKLLLVTALCLGTPLRLNLAAAETSPPEKPDNDVRSEMHLTGRYSLGSWECTSNKVAGETSLPNEPDLIDAVTKDFRSHFEVRVESFDCGNDLMEADMYHALKSSKYPTISYVQVSVTPLEPRERPDSNTLRVRSHGELSVAGVVREVALDMEVRRQDAHTIRITGETEVGMRDFDVTPPTALFGLIRARNKLHVQFETEVVARALSQPPMR